MMNRLLKKKKTIFIGILIFLLYLECHSTDDTCDATDDTCDGSDNSFEGFTYSSRGSHHSDGIEYYRDKHNGEHVFDFDVKQFYLFETSPYTESMSNVFNISLSHDGNVNFGFDNSQIIHMEKPQKNSSYTGVDWMFISQHDHKWVSAPQKYNWFFKKLKKQDPDSVLVIRLSLIGPDYDRHFVLQGGYKTFEQEKISYAEEEQTSYGGYFISFLTPKRKVKREQQKTSPAVLKKNPLEKN